MFYRANLERTVLVGANLEGADLRSAALKGLEFSGARISGAKFEGATDVSHEVLRLLTDDRIGRNGAVVGDE